MQVTQRSRLQLRLQGLLFAVLFIGIIGMLAWLSTQYHWQADWTYGGRNTVSADTRKLLDTLQDPVSITAYVGTDELLRQQIRDLVGSYQRFKPDISLEFINPDTVPEQVRKLGITEGGAVVISYHGASENIQALGEQHLTNALLRLSRQQQRWVVFVTGHGERPPSGETNFGMGAFGAELERKGLHVQTLNLADTAIPANTSLLVLASPKVALLPGEVAALQDYLARGGNLLWLSEPDALPGLQPLADALGLQQLPGQVVDTTSAQFGVENPAFVVITGYPSHPVTREMSMVTVYPEAAAFEINDRTGWESTPLLTTLSRSWTETGKLEGEIRYDPDSDERPGPLDIGVALTRNKPGGKENEQQRVAVIGDGDFLSNTYLGNGGNLDLGLNLVLWLSHDDAFIDIRVHGAPDTSLVLSNNTIASIGIGFLAGLPALLLVSGTWIWWQRRRR
jgi:ABC-type uncharacterized transport system involved in gliding motility auxiliary subunit